ncbi:hypothetical protein JTE90_018324 [Oedothorax gibbosus]|uniref:Uncharacterized protein n=1 Tax=Oedothorax gibbosus TaxID=931172 RepID=A0AAV6U196_9ARAC|nr:hypothetical protein JTE90_018324 [Oedothorax gibbosus]
MAAAYFSTSHALKNTSSENIASGNQLEDDLTPDDAASPNFYSPSSSADYSGFFDHFPDIGHFPEFGEIFRLSRTTTQRPPFRFPGYLREPFPDDDYKTDDTPPPRRRPPRPASSSSSRTKVSKAGGDIPMREKPVHRPAPKGSAHSSKTAFPKIFRFTADRVNLADFDSRKKVNENYLTLTKGDGLDSDGVRREGFLILHGGVFEIDSMKHKR